MSKAIATKEAVWAVADALMAEGVEPKVILVQARVGGGSYGTVKAHLATWAQDRAAKPVADVAMPAEIASQGEEALRGLWVSASALARRNAQAIADAALAEATAARGELSEAVEVVQRLERGEEELTETLASERKRSHDLELEVAALRVEARRVVTLEAELDAARRETLDVSGLRAAVDDLRAQVAALVARESSLSST